MKYSKQIST